MAENTAKTAKKSNFFSTFFKGVKAEAKKIAWPNREQTVKQTIAVIVISVILSVFIRLVDVLSQLLIGLVSSIG